MPVLDFLEIPRADIASGEQDSFELFARDFLLVFGYTIVSGPDRGPDGGRDIVALETRSGVAGETIIRWLVSCKHKAHSGNSVTVDDERDILDRVTANQCQGFIGFYSTLPSSALTKKLEGLRAESGIEFQLFDRERIELDLLTRSDGSKLAKRYFKISFSVWSRETPQPADLFADQHSLFCKYCGKDLLNPKSGIVVVWRSFDRDENENLIETEITDVYWCCKGKCDESLEAGKHQAGYADYSNGWEDIPDLCIPTIYLRWIAALLNQLLRGIRFRDEASERMKELIIILFPYVSRDLTTREEERIGRLLMIPGFLGGFG